MKHFLILFFFFLLVVPGRAASSIGLQLLGDSTSGYSVQAYYGDIPVAGQAQHGELDLLLQNEDYSISEHIRAWKGTKASQDAPHKITLSGTVALQRLETDLHIAVTYTIVSPHVVSKEVALRQTNLPQLYYSLVLDLRSGEAPSRLWTFDNQHHQGGVAHESYPAAGYMLGDTLAVGLLTDAGNRNLWTRNIRRRPSAGQIGFRALQEVCDANLYTLASPAQRQAGHNSVRLTLGQVSDFNHPDTTLGYAVPGTKEWKTSQGCKLTASKQQYTLAATGQPLAEAPTVRLPYSLPDGFYTLRFKHKSSQPISIRLFKGQGTEASDVQGWHYQTGIPSSGTQWVEQEGTVFLANTEGGVTQLHLGLSDIPAKEENWQLQLKDIELVQSIAAPKAYHPLMQGQAQSKKVFIFAAPAKPSLHDLRLASQVYLAEGLGFEGGTPEKCLYACYQMLMWITSARNFAPLNVPSINYAPDMYNRDAFWSLMGVHDKEASEAIFDVWAATQTEEGGIGTIITPAMGSKEVKDNDATLEFMWFALENHRRYGTPLPMDKITKAFEYSQRHFDPDKSGICRAVHVLGQNDVVTYPEKTTALSVNQGMWAVSLRVAQALGMPVNDGQIERANAAYRAFYDKKLGYLIDNRHYPDVITFNSLLPEFVSWWLFNEPILTSEMVNNTLDKVPVRNGYSPLIFHAVDTFFTEQTKPFAPEMHWDNGVYYNAGSWMREEVCGYVAGLKHGWQPARQRIDQRLQAEIGTHPDEPFSHEFLPFDTTVPYCWWPSTRVFSWNVFVLEALRVAKRE